MRQIWMGTVAGILSLLVFEQGVAADRAQGSSPPNTSAVKAGKLDAYDFAVQAAKDGRSEVALGELAEDKAKSEKVKDFGRQMVKDHGKANDELAAIAKKENLRLPDGVGPENERLKEQLASKDGGGFDRAYIDAMVDDHEKAVRLFTNFQENGDNDAFVAFARKTLPVLQHHLEQAKSLQHSLATK